MPRPQRIEYENAFYHVMNRGRGRQAIFPDDRYYQAFLETLAEAHQRFKCVIHAYCLMGNHYHLLIETPLPNLGRIMRHINGVYTQRHNHLKKTDGPLFRGRYKAILADRDVYLLQLTRYIHRNPIEMKRPTVSQLSEYHWSSYPAYIGKAKPQEWLEREMTYHMLGSKQRYKGYATYISQGVDEETAQIYNKGNQAAVIGDKNFKSWVYEELLPELETLRAGFMRSYFQSWSRKTGEESYKPISQLQI
jgi:REP element-mobilizing transposase RayT